VWTKWGRIEIVFNFFINRSQSSGGETGSDVPAARAKIVANNYNDKDWTIGVQTKEGPKNMFYFLNNSSAMACVGIGTKLIFAESDGANVTKLTHFLKVERVAILIQSTVTLNQW
jgi:hypothetical protein